MERKSDLTNEEMDNIIAFGEVLRSIHNEFVKEGKCKVVNGKIVWLINKDQMPPGYEHRGQDY